MLLIEKNSDWVFVRTEGALPAARGVSACARNLSDVVESWVSLLELTLVVLSLQYELDDRFSFVYFCANHTSTYTGYVSRSA